MREQLNIRLYMNYSTTYVAVIVNVVAYLLPKIGVSVGSDELTTTVQVLLQVCSCVWILIERYKRGDITVLGSRK